MSYLWIWVRVTPPSKPPESHCKEVKYEFSSLTSKTSCNELEFSQSSTYSVRIIRLAWMVGAHLDGIVTVLTDGEQERYHTVMSQYYQANVLI